MNRIAGILNLNNTPINLIEINRMLTVMKYHGKDVQSTWIDGEIGMGCAQFGNISSTRQNQLLSYKLNGLYSITFEGRIDNRNELMAALNTQLADRASAICNEDIVLTAYRKWGLECPKHLVGDFAFAIWDKEEHRLVCVRDHFGVKPFYYFLSKEAFVFASTPIAVLASGRVPPRIHEERIADHLVDPLEGVDKTSSFYKDLFRLPPAHMLIIHQGRTTLRRYWELLPAIPADLKTENDYIDTFRRLLEEAVRCRLGDSAVPVSMLSGGMDSSSIVGISRKILTEEGRPVINAFAVISNYPDTNRETSHIFSVLDQGGLRPHLISPTDVGQRMDELVQAIEDEGEPFDCLMNLNRSVYLQAQDQKIGALLDGLDGDVLLSGSGHLMQLWREGAFRSILRETFKAEGKTAEYKMGEKLFFNSLVSNLTSFVPNSVRKMRRQRRYKTAIDSSIEESIIDREFAFRSHLGERLAQLDSHNSRPASVAQIEYHRIALNHPFFTVGLERYERVSSSFGIEARHPFTDVRLVGFCLGLPWYLKTQRGWTKYILRRAMEPYLPSDVVWRKDKDSLMWEVNRLILKERADYFRQATLDEKESLKPYVDTRKLENIWQEYLANGDEKHAMLIWSGIALAFWLRRHRNMVRDLKLQQ